MALIRPRQRAITAVSPHNANRNYIVPNRPSVALGPVILPDSIEGGTPDPKGYRLTGPSQMLSIRYPNLTTNGRYRFYVRKAEVNVTDPDSLVDATQECLTALGVRYCDDGAINAGGNLEFTTVQIIDDYDGATFEIYNPSEYDADDYAVFTDLYAREILS